MGKLSFTPVWPLITKRVYPKAVQLHGTAMNNEVLQRNGEEKPFRLSQEKN